MHKTLYYTITSLFFFLATTVSLVAQSNLEPLEDLSFRSVGPTRGGRVTTVTGVPNRPNEFYMGSTGGGLWKTMDYGQHWKNVSDGYFATPSMGAVRVAPSNPDIVYAGTGSDGLRSNVIVGKGVYKSIDAGKTWQHLGLEKAGQIGAVEIDPSSPDRVFVAAIGQPFAPNAERGVYRTLNGGKSWEKVLFLSDTIGAVDIEFAPNNARIVYATMWRAERKPWTIISGGYQAGGIYKSTDGGNTWKKLEKGLPPGLIGKIDLAVSAADPKRLYALVEAPVGKGGVYCSYDEGDNFTLLSTNKALLDRPFYYCNIDAHPQDADIVFVNSTRFFRSDDGGKGWRRLSTPHGDNHDIWINPDNPQIWVQGNDGGANVTLDGGATWSSQQNQPTAELYQVEVDDRFPYWLYAGQQDNSTIRVPSLPPFNSIAGATKYWEAVGGCETGPAVPKPGDPDIVYSNCKGRFGVYNHRTGQERRYYVGASNMYGHNPKDLKFRFQRVAPIHVSPHNPKVVYHASQYLHKTLDEGQTWEIISPDLTANLPETQVISGSPITRDITGEEFYSTIYAVKESPLEAGLIWVGANDGPIHVTQDGGKNWRKVTPKGLAPGGRVQCVEPSPHQAGKAYVAVYRYLLGDWQPYIYKTEDYGKTWQRLTTGKNGIPTDYPTRVIREDPDREGLLYAGTEFGLFISMDDGKTWQKFQKNLPVTPITDIKVFRKDLILSTMGRGFWIMDNLTPLHQLDKEEKPVILFKPRDAHRMHYRGNSSWAIPHYPSPGLQIDYYLAEKPQGKPVLEVLNAQGKIIRSFESKGLESDTMEQAEVSMATGFLTWQGGNGLLPRDKGGHRVRWNMRHEGPIRISENRRDQNGPLVAPGNYSLRLKVDGRMIEQPFKILPDPRVEKEGVKITDIQAQEVLILQVRDLFSKARRMASQVKEREKVINRELNQGKNDSNLMSQKKAVESMKKQLLTSEGRYQEPQIVDQISYLYNMLRQADQKPGKDSYDRYKELKKELESLKTDWEQYFGTW